MANPMRYRRNSQSSDERSRTERISTKKNSMEEAEIVIPHV